MKVVIIDDEPNAIKAIDSLVRLLFPKIAVVGTGSSVAEGIREIELKKPDLIFLDIQMPDGDGFRLLDSLTGNKPAVIFTTAHQEFGHKAFRYDAADYLLKPIDPEELKHAVEKLFRSPIDKSPITASETTTHIELDEENSLEVKQKTGSIWVRYDEIIRLEGEGSYTTIVLTNKSTVMASKGLKNIEAQLPESYFLRIHQSHVVNLKHTTGLTTYLGKTQVTTLDGASLPIAARRKACIKEIEDWQSN